MGISKCMIIMNLSLGGMPFPLEELYHFTENNCKNVTIQLSIINSGQHPFHPTIKKFNTNLLKFINITSHEQAFMIHLTPEEC